MLKYNKENNFTDVISVINLKKSLSIAFLCICTPSIFLGCSTAYISTKSNLLNNNQPNTDSFFLSDENITYNNSNKSEIPVINSKFSILVNKSNNLDKDYIPDTKIPNIPYATNSSVRYDIVESVENLFKDAKKEGLDLILVSGYRSYDLQASIYNNNLKNKGEAWTSQFSAKPGQSEHQTGLALDISSVSQGGGLYQSFGNTEEGKWLEENCAKYGFILRFLDRKEDITGYTYEPWHFRYVGVEVAEYIMKNNLTFEEYLKLINN